MAEREVRVGGRPPVSAPASAWLMGVAAWALPGAGHLLQGRWGRGLALGGAVWVMFVAGLVFGGHLFTFIGQGEGWSALMHVPAAIANLGMGILYLVCLATKTGLTEFAELSTFEYGNTLLLVAGLLNYLAMLDAFDIAAGRKS